MAVINPLVTVVIPSYNHEHFVAMAIESVLKQTYGDLELVVIDDASTDSSWQIIRNYEHDPRVRLVLNEKNRGLTANLNAALGSARGKYFCMLSSDDIWMPDKLEKIIPYLESNSAVACCGASHIVIDETGRCLKKQSINPFVELSFDDVFLRRKDGAPSAATTTFVTQVLRDVGGYDEDILLEDMDIWLKITHAGYQIVCLNDVMAYYRKHPENTSKKNALMYQSIVEIWSKYKNHPGFEYAINKQRKSFFIRACKRDKALAWKILKDIPVRQYDIRIIRGILKYFGLPS